MKTFPFVFFAPFAVQIFYCPTTRPRLMTISIGLGVLVLAGGDERWLSPALPVSIGWRFPFRNPYAARYFTSPE